MLVNINMNAHFPNTVLLPTEHFSKPKFKAFASFHANSSTMFDVDRHKPTPFKRVAQKTSDKIFGIKLPSGRYELADEEEILDSYVTSFKLDKNLLKMESKLPGNRIIPKDMDNEDLQLANMQTQEGVPNSFNRLQNNFDKPGSNIIDMKNEDIQKEKEYQETVADIEEEKQKALHQIQQEIHAVKQKLSFMTPLPFDAPLDKINKRAENVQILEDNIGIHESNKQVAITNANTAIKQASEHRQSVKALIQPVSNVYQTLKQLESTSNLTNDEAKDMRVKASKIYDQFENGEDSGLTPVEINDYLSLRLESLIEKEMTGNLSTKEQSEITQIEGILKKNNSTITFVNLKSEKTIDDKIAKLEKQIQDETDPVEKDKLNNEIINLQITKFGKFGGVDISKMTTIQVQELLYDRFNEYETIINSKPKLTEEERKKILIYTKVFGKQFSFGNTKNTDVIIQVFEDIKQKSGIYRFISTPPSLATSSASAST